MKSRQKKISDKSFVVDNRDGSFTLIKDKSGSEVFKYECAFNLVENGKIKDICTYSTWKVRQITEKEKQKYGGCFGQRIGVFYMENKAKVFHVLRKEDGCLFFQTNARNVEAFDRYRALLQKKEIQQGELLSFSNFRSSRIGSDEKYILRNDYEESNETNEKSNNVNGKNTHSSLPEKDHVKAKRAKKRKRKTRSKDSVSISDREDWSDKDYECSESSKESTEEDERCNEPPKKKRRVHSDDIQSVEVPLDATSFISNTNVRPIDDAEQKNLETEQTEQVVPVNENDDPTPFLREDRIESKNEAMGNAEFFVSFNENHPKYPVSGGNTTAPEKINRLINENSFDWMNQKANEAFINEFLAKQTLTSFKKT